MDLPLKVITVKNFYKYIENQDIANLFTKVIQTKKAGYLTRHEDRFIPVGTHDFFSIHLVLCHGTTLEPILVSKIVSYKDCIYFNQPFPLLELKDILPASLQFELEKIINERANKGSDISYSGGWTINPQYKGLGLSQELRDIYTGIHYNAHLHYNISTMMGFGVPKVGSLEFFKTWGVKPLSANGVDMPPTPIPFGNFVESVIAWGDIDKLSDYKKQMAQKYAYLWEQRIEYPSTQDVNIIRKVA